GARAAHEHAGRPDIGALDGEAPQIHPRFVERVFHKDASFALRHQDAGGAGAVVDDVDRLVDRHGAVAAGIENADRAPGGGLGSAALKVRHGAGRVQPWASLPPAETKLRMINPSGACARAGPAPAASTSRVAAANGNSVNFDMNALPSLPSVR